MMDNMIELIEKRTPTGKHFLNPDGSYTAQIAIEPIHYKDENGNFQDCELDIVPESNWEFEYVVRKNTFTAYFNDSTDIENFTLASFEIKNSQGVSRWINYKLFGPRLLQAR